MLYKKNCELINKLICLTEVLLNFKRKSDIYDSNQSRESLEYIINKTCILLGKMESELYISDEYILQQKHEIMLALIMLKTKVNISISPLILFLSEQFETSYISKSTSNKFEASFLSLTLFSDEIKFKSGKIHADKKQIDFIKYLIEDGNDIIYATHYFLTKQMTLNDMPQLPVRERFNQIIGLFFRKTQPEQVENLIRSYGCDDGFYIKKYKCAISNEIPIFPVIYKNKIYDLFDLSLALKAKECRATPYEFILNGELVDSHQIQFYSSYHSDLKNALRKKNSIPNLYDQTRTLLSYNRYFFMWLGIISFSLISIMQIIYSLIPNKHVRKIAISEERKIILDMLVKVSSSLLPFSYEKYNNRLHTHPNPYIRRIGIFNASYLFSMCILSFSLSFSGKYNSDAIMFPALPFSKFDHNVIFNLFADYSICITLYIAGSLTHINTIDPTILLYMSPKECTASPVLEKEQYYSSQKERNRQRKQLTLSFNRLIATGKAPCALIGGHEGYSPIIEKILDFNFKPKFTRYRYG